MERILTEVCCGSVDDAVRAYRAGADRVELNCCLEGGGLTPSLGMLRAALQAAKLPIICMVRPRAGGFYYTGAEFSAMLEDARILMEAGAAGLAFGCLKEDGGLDRERCARMIEAAGGGEMVFHRAFDVMRGDMEEELEELIALGFTRVLTSGRAAAAPEGAEAIGRLVRRSNGRIEILAGGGVRPHNAEKLLRRSGVGQLHFSFHTAWEDRSAEGAAMSFDAPGAVPFAVRIVEEEGLDSFLRQLRGLRQNGI